MSIDIQHQELIYQHLQVKSELIHGDTQPVYTMYFTTVASRGAAEIQVRTTDLTVVDGLEEGQRYLVVYETRHGGHGLENWLEYRHKM